MKYDMFMKALDGLKALGLVEHRKGRTRSQDTGFGFRVTVPGRAARFWATAKLLKLAEEHCDPCTSIITIPKRHSDLRVALI